MKTFAETERLILREMIAEDAQGMFDLDSDPAVAKFLLGMKPQTHIDESKAVIKGVQEQYKTLGIGRWAVILKASNEFVGWAGLKLMKRPVNGHTDFYDLGYRLQQKHWGKGYATEASIATLHYGFGEMKLNEICGYAEEAHQSSRKVLEKVGLRFIENFTDDGIAESWYKITREEYLKLYPAVR